VSCIQLLHGEKFLIVAESTWVQDAPRRATS